MVVTYCLCCRKLTRDSQCMSKVVLKSGNVFVEGKKYSASLCKWEEQNDNIPVFDVVVQQAVL